MDGLVQEAELVSHIEALEQQADGYSELLDYSKKMAANAGRFSRGRWRRKGEEYEARLVVTRSELAAARRAWQEFQAYNDPAAQAERIRRGELL